ncbi:MAG: tetratricopeptide repeat protein [Deltaproteobacteria bacterium]
MPRKKSIAVRKLKGLAGSRSIFALFCLAFVLTTLLPATELQAAGQVTDREREVAGTPTDASQASLDEAIRLARQKIATDPSSEENLVQLGNLLLKKGSLEEAAKAFDGALSINGKYHDALTGKGIVLERLGKDQEAEETLQKALLLNPNPVRTYYELGSLYEKRGDFAKAVTEYKKGVEKYKQGRK